MADTSLILGSFTFQGFEIPEEVNLGGEQAISVKKLVGGQRVADPLGEDPDDISWSGRFQTPDALQRAMALDEMYRGGQQQQLTLFGLSYTVLVKRFSWKPQRFYQVLYSITL